MNERRLQISEGLRKLLSYPKFAGEAPRLFLLESNYWLDGACRHAAEQLGWRVGGAPVVLEGCMPRDMVGGLIRAVAEFRPDFMLTVNLSGMDDAGLFAQIFGDLEIPLVSWFVDDPRTILMDRTVYGSPYSVALTWERSYVPYLAGLGFAEVHALPLAVDTEVFNAAPGEAWDLPPAFVGNSMTEFAAREWAWTESHPPVAEALREAFSAGRVHRHAFAQGLEAMLGPCVAHFDPDERRHAEMVCFIEGTRRLRRGLIEALSSENVCACGDPAWSEIAPMSAPHIDYTSTLPQFYARCEVNLNTTSIQMATTVNQRVFDCPAAGGFLLTDAQSEIEELFDPDSEVAVYHDFDEAREKLRYYRAQPQLRREIVQRARARILAHHTYAHRLERILEILRARYAS